MVRWFVENEAIPFTRQQLCESNTLLLTAREFAGISFTHCTHAQFVEHCIALPGAAHCVTHCASGQFGNLWQHANACITAATNDACFRIIFARQQTQQRALAAAVQSNNTKAIASTYGDRDIVE